MRIFYQKIRHNATMKILPQKFCFFVKIPSTSPLFPMRIQHFSFFVDAFYSLFDEFLEILKNEERWEETVREMQTWIEDRESLA